MNLDSPLFQQDCIPCKGGVPPLTGDDLKLIHERLGGDWEVVNQHHLRKEFTFPDFAEALTFTNGVGALAEQQGHHPDIHLAWGRVVVTIWTHKIDGLVESDFILAAKIDRMVAEQQAE